MTHIRLSHPWQWHRTLDVLEVGVDLTAAEARRLIRGGIAVDVADLIRPRGGGWFDVDLSDGNTTKAHGFADAIRELRKASGQW